MWRVVARAARPAVPRAAPTVARRAMSQPAARGGIGVGAMAVGMLGAAGGGIGIGLMLPTEWLADLKKELHSEVAKDLGRHGEQPLDAGANEPEQLLEQRENSTYENVKDIAEDIPRPAIIQDATREEVESLYEFHSCIASGGSATVWRATEIATGKAVAIKVVDKRLLLAPFLNMEVASLVRCTGHANIVQLHAAYDIGPDDVSPDGEWHLVLELAEGGELFERLVQHGAYTEKVASTVLRQVARAVYHMHSVGICHRDIKPENVVLNSKDADSAVKLIDFGAAVLLNEGEHVIAGGKVGTWTYWAPEQADASRAYDQAVDMWSVGVLLYIMLSGRHPFERPAASGRGKKGEDDTKSNVMSNILNARYSFDAEQWHGISGRARQLVTQLLEPDPDKRLTAAQLLAHSWVRGEGVPERPLPDTVERLRAFKTASTAIHGSLLMAALLHQEQLREQLKQSSKRSAGGWLSAALGGGRRGDSSSGGGAGGGGGGGGGQTASPLRRSTTEGIGMLNPEEDFNVVRAAWKLFDPDGKGHISAADLYRVCNQLGYPVSERDVENMLSVLAPSESASGQRKAQESIVGDRAAANVAADATGAAGRAVGDADGQLGAAADRNISYDKFAKMMESSYRRTFKPGEAIFSQGDAVDGFYIVTQGECRVLVTSRKGEEPTEITKLGPGDFFGETGLLEGRGTRNSSVICTTSVEVLMIDNAMVRAASRRRRRRCCCCRRCQPPRLPPVTMIAAHLPAYHFRFRRHRRCCRRAPLAAVKAQRCQPLSSWIRRHPHTVQCLMHIDQYR